MKRSNPIWRAHVLSVMTDNTKAIFYINRQKRSMLHPMSGSPRADFCIAPSIHLEASYLLGSQNELADHLSRSFHGHEWSICSDIMNSIFQQWGIPQVDLFTKKTNRKYQQFCTFLNHSLGSTTDVSSPWEGPSVLCVSHPFRSFTRPCSRSEGTRRLSF